VDTIFDRVDAFQATSFPWCVTLGFPNWRNPLLCLGTDNEADGWNGNRKIDFLRRGFGDKFQVLTSTKAECQVWELDVKNFVLGKCILHCEKDVDGVLMALKRAKGGQKVLDIILNFLASRHDFTDSMRTAKKWLKTKCLDEFVRPSQPRASQPRMPLPLPSQPRTSQPSQGGGEGPAKRKRSLLDNTVCDSQKSAGTSSTPRKRPMGRSTPTTSGTTGSGARETDVPEDTPSVVAGSTAVARRPALRLQRVRTHSEAEKSVSADNWQQQQLKLFETHGIRTETIIINIGSLYPPVREGQGELGPYQVRPIQNYFLE
jgi:hypothetical protein